MDKVLFAFLFFKRFYVMCKWRRVTFHPQLELFLKDICRIFLIVDCSIKLYFLPPLCFHVNWNIFTNMISNRKGQFCLCVRNAFVLRAHAHVNCEEGSLSVSISRQMHLQCLLFGHMLLHPKAEDFCCTCASSVHKN